MPRPLPDGALPAAVWRADQLGQPAMAGYPSGFPALDAQLPGAGWPLGMLIELLSAEPGIGEIRLLVPVLHRLTRERRTVILLAPPLIPYAPALASFGIALDHLLIVQAAQPADRLWAIEQTLKSADFGALLAWLPDTRTRADHLRRLQLAAQTARGPVFLFRPAEARHESSPAPLRLRLEAAPDQQLQVELIKRRGPLLGEPLTLHLPMPDRTLSPRSHRRAPAPSLVTLPPTALPPVLHRSAVPASFAPASAASSSVVLSSVAPAEDRPDDAAPSRRPRLVD